MVIVPYSNASSSSSIFSLVFIFLTQLGQLHIVLQENNVRMSETIKLSYVSVRDYEGKENVRYILLWKIGDLVCYSKGENVFTAKGESSMKKVVLLIV